MNIKDIMYVSSGNFITSEKWIHPNRYIDTHEIIFMTEGKAYIQENERKYCLSPGDILYLEPGKNHKGYMYNKKGEKVSFYWMHFTCSHSIKNIKYFSLQNPSAIAILMKQLLHYTNTPNYSSEIYNYIVRIIIETIILDSKMLSTGNMILISDICEYIRNNTDKKIKVKDLADYFGYNESYLSRIFKEKYNVGIKQYINAEKIKYAKSLLVTTQYPIKKIGYLCGFDDEKEFLKFFKYYEKLSPGQFRKGYFNTHINRK